MDHIYKHVSNKNKKTIFLSVFCGLLSAVCSVTAAYTSLCIFWLFSYIINEHLCLKYCVFTKLSQFVCLINIHISYVNMSNVTVSYGKFSNLIAFFLGIFHIITRCFKLYRTSSNFYKLYVKAKVYKWKVSLCKYLWLHYSSLILMLRCIGLAKSQNIALSVTPNPKNTVSVQKIPFQFKKNTDSSCNENFIGFVYM